MRFRDSVALNFAPLCLRAALGIVFLMAGAVKVFHDMEVSGESAALLANYGIIKPAGATPQPTPPAVPELLPPEEDEGENGTARGPGSGATLASQPNYALASGWQPPRYTAADFPEPVKVRGMNGLVLFLHSAVHPPLHPETSAPLRPLWPDFDRSRDFDPWPVYAARAVAFTELIGGAFVLIGLLTRLGALGLAGTMLGAMWLTQFGPAIQMDRAFLGFLPNHAWHDGLSWKDLLFQFTLFAAAMSLFCTGSGTLAADRFFASGPGEPPKTKKRKPKDADEDED